MYINIYIYIYIYIPVLICISTCNMCIYQHRNIEHVEPVRRHCMSLVLVVRQRDSLLSNCTSSCAERMMCAKQFMLEAFQGPSSHGADATTLCERQA